MDSKRLIVLAIAASSLTASIASAQSQQQIHDDQALQREQAEGHAAYKSRDPKRIAALSVQARSVYDAEWRDHHPRAASAASSEDANARLDRVKADLRPKHGKLNAEETSRLRAAYLAAWKENHNRK